MSVTALKPTSPLGQGMTSVKGTAKYESLEKSKKFFLFISMFSIINYVVCCAFALDLRCHYSLCSAEWCNILYKPNITVCYLTH